MNWEETTLRLFIACLLGSLIGFERQWHQRTAGLRTNMLVCVGSAGFTVFGAIYLDGESVPRIVAQIVSGIGFLGAGAILREGFTISGLNTAATVWCSAALGSFCGAGYQREALIFTFFIVVINTFLREFENYMSRMPLKTFHHSDESSYIIEAQCETIHLENLRKNFLDILSHRRLSMRQVEAIPHENGRSTLKLTLRVKISKESQVQLFMEEIALNPYVLLSKWNHAPETL